jgi:inner membrane protein
MEKTSLIDRFNNWARRSIGLKLLSIGALILILLIPATMLNSLIRERQQTRDAAVEEINSKWGSSQIIGGPIITIPYKISIKNNDGKWEDQIKYAHFLPDNIKIKGEIIPEKRYRGNIKSHEFQSNDFQVFRIAEKIPGFVDADG